MHFDCLNSSNHDPFMQPKQAFHATNKSFSHNTTNTEENERLMMKEGGRSANGRSALERERTKMRERQRRSITTNIFHGLRKHGGYRLSPHADINEVLRHLAQEAGWTVDNDGTTYRSAAAASTSAGATSCPLCGGGGRSVAATPSCSFLGGGGECSTTASPRRVGESGGNNLSSSGVGATDDSLLSIYMSGGAAQNDGGGGGSAVFGEGQQLYLVRESRVANQNTPTGSP